MFVAFFFPENNQLVMTGARNAIVYDVNVIQRNTLSHTRF